MARRAGGRRNGIAAGPGSGAGGRPCGPGNATAPDLRRGGGAIRGQGFRLSGPERATGAI